MAESDSYSLSDSIADDAPAPEASPKFVQKTQFQDPSMDSFESGDLLSSQRSATAAAPSQSQPKSRRQSRTPPKSRPRSPLGASLGGPETSASPALSPDEQQRQQGDGARGEQQHRGSHPAQQSSLSASLPSSYGELSADLSDQGGQLGAPYARAPGPYNTYIGSPVGVRGPPGQPAHHSSDYSSGSYGLDAEASNEGWVSTGPAGYQQYHHPYNPYTSAVPQGSPYYAYQGTSPTATPSSALTFQHWQQATPSSASRPYQYPGTERPLRPIRDDSDDEYGYTDEDGLSSHEGHGVPPLAIRFPGGTKLGHSSTSIEYSGDFSPRSRPSRPSSAAVKGKKGQNFEDTMKGRLDAAVAEACKRHICTWDVLDVCNWVESIGFLCYRKKFAHNSIDGPLLMELTDEQMRKGLNILPLGHRETLKKKIQELRQLSDAMGEDASTKRKGKPEASPHQPRMPASASPNVIPAAGGYLGPAQGKMTVKEQRDKLNYELDRMANKAAQAKALIEQLSHNKGLTDEEVRRLRGQLAVVEAEYKASERKTGVTLDPDAAVPWIPNNFLTEERHPERYAKPGDYPEVELTFTPRVTHVKDVPNDKGLREVRDGVKHVYSLPKIWERMEKETEKKEKQKEAVSNLEKDAEQEQNMAALNDVMADTKTGPKAAQGQLGYWIPGGIGNKHKLPKGANQEDQVVDKGAHDITKSVRFLERMFTKWQCNQRLGPSPGTNARETRFPYPELLETIDDFIDALLTPKNEVIGAFPMSIHAFFRENNFDLNMNKTPKGDLVPPPMLKRLAGMKGYENLTELDKAKLKLALLAKPTKKDDGNTNPVADLIMKRKFQKVKAAAGIIKMAEFVGRGYGRRKAKSGDGDSSDDEERGKEASKTKKKDQKSGQNKLPYGPWISNGILERGIKAEGLAVQRMGLFRKKMGFGDANIEAGRSHEDQSRSALERDAAKADQFFQLLGWHFALEPEGASDKPPPEKTGELINKLLRRALAIAGRKDQHIDMTKQAKAYKAELVRDLNLKLSKLHPKDPAAKEVQQRLTKVKGFSMDIEPPPPIDFDAPEWREDGLSYLQEMELDRLRERLNRQWERDRRKQHNAAMKAAQRMPNIDEVDDVDWEHADQPGWEVEDLLLAHNYLPYCCNLLGQLPSSELKKFLRMHPSGIDEGSEDQNGGADQDEGIAGLQLERYDVDADGPGQKRWDDDENQAAERRRAEIKALKLKKVRVFRAIMTMKFVESTDAKTNEREKKMANALLALDEEKRSRQRVITPHEQDNFFARLLGDIDARRIAMEQRQIAQMNSEKESLKQFKANPYSPPPRSRASSSGHQSRQRSRSPGSGPSSPGRSCAPFYRAQSPTGSTRGGESSEGRGRSPPPRAGGGFAYWHVSGGLQAPRTRARASAHQQRHPDAQPQQQQRRPASASARGTHRRGASGPAGETDGAVEYAWPSGAPVDPQHRPKSAAPVTTGRQRALAGYTSGGPGGIRGHRVVGEAGPGVGTFGQAAARPGERRVDTSPEGVAARSPRKQRSPSRREKEKEGGGVGGAMEEGVTARQVQQWRQQAAPLLSDSESASPQPSPRATPS